MKHLHLSIVVLVLAACATEARAQGKIEWADGYPTKSTNLTGGITIKGTITADAGWTPTKAKARVWESGKGVSEFPVLFDQKTYAWGPADLKMASGVTYNLTVEVIMAKNAKTQIIITAPATATAK
jgi:hypothetical protein